MYYSSIQTDSWSNRFLFLLSGLIVFYGALLSPSVRAQSGGGVDLIGTGGSHTIQGRVYFPSGRQADLRLKVKLESTSSPSLSVLTDPSGSFSFRSLGPGHYTIVIDDNNDYEIVRESVFIDPDLGQARSGPRSVIVPIYLQLKRTFNTGAKPGLLNAALANVPQPAVEFYNRGLEAASKGESKKAIEYLKSAVSAYPQFALAYNELGVQYLRIGQADKAAEALLSTIKLTPNEFTPRLNCGIALLNKNDFAGAETQLREALKKNNASPLAHMYLGVALAKLHKYDEAESELQRSASTGKSEVSMAHKYLGGLYWSKKDYKRAADELEKYLELSPKAPDAERIRGTVKELRSKS